MVVAEVNILMHIDSLGPGGAQRQIVILAIALAARGHRVEFNTYYPFEHFRPILDQAGIPVRTRVKAHRLSPGPVFALARHARAMKADVVVAFLRTPMIHAELLKLLLTRAAIVVSERFAFPQGKLPAPLYAAQQLHRLADFVTVNSAHQAQRMIVEFPWLMNKCGVILNGYELANRPAPLPVIDGDLRLLALGSVHARKNPLSLAKALNLCRRERGIPVKVFWAGEAWKSNGACPAQDETDAFLQANGLSDHWVWLGLQSDIRSCFEGKHALIHPSNSEGFSNAVAEALIEGRPVLIGRTGDQERLVTESCAGLLFDTGAPVSIADAITRFFELSDDARAEMGTAARSYAEDRLGADRMADEYETLFQRLCHRRRPQRA